MAMDEPAKAVIVSERDAVTRTTDCNVCRAKAGERCLNTATSKPLGGFIVHGGRATTWLAAGKPQEVGS